MVLNSALRLEAAECSDPGFVVAVVHVALHIVVMRVLAVVILRVVAAALSLSL